VIEDTEVEIERRKYKNQADHLQNQVEGLKDKQRLFTEKHEMEKTNLELIDDLKKRHGDEIQTMKAINDSKSRHSTGTFSDQRTMIPLMEKLEACYDSLSSLKSEFTIFLKEGYAEQKQSLISERNSLKEQQKEMEQQMKSHEKLVKNLNQMIDDITLEKVNFITFLSF